MSTLTTPALGFCVDLDNLLESKQSPENDATLLLQLLCRQNHNNGPWLKILSAVPGLLGWRSSPTQAAALNPACGLRLLCWIDVSFGGAKHYERASQYKLAQTAIESWPDVRTAAPAMHRARNGGLWLALPCQGYATG
jgi:hypothetical protein